MSFCSESSFLRIVVFCATLSGLQAGESFESLVSKLADDQYAVRVAARKDLIEMCRKQPELIDRLAPVVLDEQDEIERVLTAREVVAEALYVERGVIGFRLNHNMTVARVAAHAPAEEAGIQRSWKLIKLGGKPVKGMHVGKVYAMIHNTRPGAELEMEFTNEEGETVVVRPTVAPRSTVRSDENVEQRKQEAYEQWLVKKRKELQSDAD